MALSVDVNMKSTADQHACMFSRRGPWAHFTPPGGGGQVLGPLSVLLLTYVLTPWTRALLEKLTGSQSKYSPHFMEPEGSLKHSEVPAILFCS